MKKDSKQGRAVVLAYEKGYRVKDGKVFNCNDKELKLTIQNASGIKYKRFCIKDEFCDRRVVLVHQLMAYQKFGEKVFETEVVRHLNGDSLDNSFENIMIGSQSENMRDVDEAIRIKNAKYATSFVTKYNHKDVIDYYNEGHSYSEVMKKFNISSKGTVSFIIKKSNTCNNI